MIDLKLLDAVSPCDIQKKIAGNLCTVRKRRKISQQRLSQLSGVSYSSIRRFERDGEISLFSLTKIAIALGLEQELAGLFSEVGYLSIEEILHEQKKQDKSNI